MVAQRPANRKMRPPSGGESGLPPGRARPHRRNPRPRVPKREPASRFDGAPAMPHPIRPLHWKHLSSKTGDLPVPPGSDQQTSCLILDADKDGRNDFVITCRNKAPAIAWYRPMKSGWTVYLIETESIPI